MEDNKTPRKLWEHDDPTRTEMFTFMKNIDPAFKTFQDIHEFSIQNRSDFYNRLFQWAGLIHEGSYDTVVDTSAPIDSVPIWFSGVHLNWAENILYSRNRSDAKDYQGRLGKKDDKIAVSQIREGNTGIKHVSWAQLRHDAGRLASALKTRGLRQGDRVIIVAANSVETLLVFLTTTWLGAIFSSVSTEMGVNEIL